MRLYELLEDAKTDTIQLKTAREALKGLISWLRHNDIKNKKTVYLSTNGGRIPTKVISLGEVYSSAPAELKYLKIMFSENFTSTTALGAYSNASNTIFIFIDPFKYDSLPIEQQESWHEVFVHELIHAIDYRRAPGIENKNDQSDQDYSDYINSPVEFNAHYQQAVHNFEEFIEQVKEKNPDSYSKIKELLFNDKAKFCKFVLNRAGLLDDLNGTYLRKANKRLSKYYDEHRDRLERK